MIMIDWESTFDPTDADEAMQLAYKSLELCEWAARAVYASNSGVLLGRDDTEFLCQAIVGVAKCLGFLPYDHTGKAVDELIAHLADIHE